MPTLDQHPSSSIVKLLYIGDSSTGKTGSLAALLEAGYSLGILDTDNGLDSLRQYAPKDSTKRVRYESPRDKYRPTINGPVCTAPKAFVECAKLLEKWSDGTDPAHWGPECIFVLDSLSSLGKCAFEWARGMAPSAKDPRQWYFAAQQAIENTIAMITSKDFNTNVVIISHVNWKEMQDGATKGYPNAIGSALGPIIARYFNTLILAESSGSGKNTKRKIKTLPTGVIDLKAASPKVEAEYPLETGLSAIFANLKEK